MGIFGKAHFSDVQAERWTQAHQAEPKYASVSSGTCRPLGIRRIWDWRYGFLFLPSGCAVSAVLAWKNRARSDF